MDFKIFKNKKLSAAGDKMMLAQPTMLFKSLNPEEYTMVAKHIASDDDIVRPDRIAVKHYGVTEGLDIILKFNGISDPFSIMPGEIIFVPIDTIPYFKLETPSTFEDNPIKNQFLKTKRLSKTDQRRLKALKKKYNKESLLPPNVIPVGRKNYEFDGTDVRLGMGPQTDPVVSSILSDINNENDDGSGNGNGDGSGTGNGLVLDVNDNSQNGNGNGNDSGNGSGTGQGGLGVNDDDNAYEDHLNNGSGKGGTGNGSSDGSGTGNGSSDGTGTGNSTTNGGKTDEADGVGGGIPDGSSPGSSDSNPASDPDSPCSK